MMLQTLSVRARQGRVRMGVAWLSAETSARWKCAQRSRIDLKVLLRKRGGVVEHFSLSNKGETALAKRTRLESRDL